MDTEECGVSMDIVTFYPENFFRKMNNESFVQMLMQTAFPNTYWKKGCPNKFEPDYFCNETPFEFTIASNRNAKQTFVAQLMHNKYATDNLEGDVFSYIRESIKVKSLKRYSVVNVHLCILCLLDMFNWVSDEYGSVTHCILDYQREQFFNEIKQEFILTKKFSNVFIIFPDISAKWWIWDVLSNRKTCFQLTDDMIKGGEYPYSLLKDVYDRIFAGEGL